MRQPLALRSVLILIAMLAIGSVAILSDNLMANQQGDDYRLRNLGRVRAPELEGGAGWLNTDRPLKLANLRGKVVLLDFWTYCCINCIHIVPELKKLEEKYAKELIVIGVHSAKFDNEKDVQNIRQAILRYEIEHPVVNDPDFEIWQSYAVRAWPTLVLIDPEGYVAGVISGEGHFDELDAAIAKLSSDFRAKGKLNEQPFTVLLEKQKVLPGVLSFPGKVLADEAGQRLFISDSNHNRIVITNLSGELLEVIGSGSLGRTDGDFQTAAFNHPQGMALSADGRYLYIGDTENHLLRRVDLKQKLVVTIAGTGVQSRRFNEFGPAYQVALNSPWDVELDGNKLYIAMAGPHQIWVMNLITGEIGPFAGSGIEARIDGPRNKAALAQPSGLAFDGKVLYVADSEISTIRAVDVGDRGEVFTVVGSGDLFGFGDQDGDGEKVRLQHPLGVEWKDGVLYVADTYNHKIKMVIPREGSSRTLLGSGKPGYEDGKTPTFYEPSGLSFASDKLYIADTNNHAIRVFDLKTKEVSTLKIKGLSSPLAKKFGDGLPNREDVNVPVQKVAPGKPLDLLIDLKLPKGFHLNPDATQSYRVKADAAIKAGEEAKGLKSPELPIKISLNTDASAQRSKLEVQFTIYYCPVSNAGACLIKSLVWNVPVEFDKKSKETSIKLQHEVK